MADTAPPTSAPRVDYRTDPSQYRHWKLATDGAIARLSLDIAEDGGLRLPQEYLLSIVRL